MAFQDRPDAGRRLAHRLEHLRGCRVVVLALARGGAPVAFEVARALSVPMDVVVAKRIEDPFMSGLTVGAVAEGGVAVTDAPALRLAGISAKDLAGIARGHQVDVDRRARRMRAGRAPVALLGRTALLIDDGVATGATARAACRAVRARGPERLVLAVPVASADAMVGLEDEAEEIVCIDRPGWLAGLTRGTTNFPSPPTPRWRPSCVTWRSDRPIANGARSLERARRPRDRRALLTGGALVARGSHQPLGAAERVARLAHHPRVVLLPGQPVHHVDDAGQFFHQVDDQAGDAAALEPPDQ